MPEFRAPDEQPHFNYVRYLVEERELPVQTSRTGASTNDWEYYQPPLYYLSAVPVYLAAQAAFDDRASVVRALRAWSVLLWLLGAGFAWHFLRLLRVEDGVVQVAVMGLVGLLPTYVALSSAINNDNLVVPLGAAILCVLARPPRTAWGAVALGILLALALWTKLTAVIYLVALAAVAGFEWLERRDRAALGRRALSAAVAVVLWSPWLLRNVQVYGSPTAEEVANVPRDWGLARGLAESLVLMARSFWAVAGIRNEVGSWFGPPGALLAMVAAVGLATAERRERVRPLVPSRGFAAAMLVTLAIHVVLVLRFGVAYGQAQGRFLFPLLLPLAVLFGLGLRAWGLPRAREGLAALLAAYGVAFTAYGVGVLRAAG